MNSASAAVGNSFSCELERAPGAPNEFPQGLKPDSLHIVYGAAKAAPLQNLRLGTATLRWTWALFPLTFAAAVVTAPYFLTHGFPAIGFAFIAVSRLSATSGQSGPSGFSARSMAVCSRCLGIYLGAAVGLLFRTSRRTAFRLLIAAAALNVLDAMTELAGWHGNWLIGRFIFGLLLGAAGALLISSAAFEVRRI